MSERNNRVQPGKHSAVAKQLLNSLYRPGTVIFHAYPSGNTLDFYNLAQPWVQELGSMRCAEMIPPGGIKILGYFSSANVAVRHILRHHAGLSLPADHQILSLPSGLNQSVRGRARNRQLIAALRHHQNILMAQPFSQAMNAAIDPRLVSQLGDKLWIRGNLIDEHLLPAVRMTFPHGRAFHAYSLSTTKIDFPCVVKVSRASAGDGVGICRDGDEFRKAQKRFRNSLAPVFIEEFIEIKENIGVQYVIPFGGGAPVITWANRQITDHDGRFLSGIVSDNAEGVDEAVARHLEETVLIRMREAGWTGMGNLDIFGARDGRWLISEVNPRLTGLSPVIWKKQQGAFRGKHLLAFTGKLATASPGVVEMVDALCREGDHRQIVTLAALSIDEERVALTGAVIFDQMEALKENIEMLRRWGVRAAAFGALLDRG
jgi:hypothetical protein